MRKEPTCSTYIHLPTVYGETPGNVASWLPRRLAEWRVERLSDIRFVQRACLHESKSTAYYPRTVLARDRYARKQYVILELHLGLTILEKDI